MALLDQTVNSMPPPDITSLKHKSRHVFHKLFVTQNGELLCWMNSKPYYIMARGILSLPLDLQTWLDVNGFHNQAKSDGTVDRYKARLVAKGFHH